MHPHYMITRKYITKEQALQKLKHYCSYQERCHSEVKEKLYSLGLHKGDVEATISDLIEGNYLNEERFAQQFAGGKFRMNGWGRQKIIYALQQKKVSAYCIKTGLKEINDTDYEATLSKLAESKWKLLKGEQYLSRQAKTYAYLLQKGYEAALIKNAIAKLKENNLE
jgi:regulatory protein